MSFRAITRFMSTPTDPTTTPYSAARRAARRVCARLRRLRRNAPGIDARPAEDTALDDDDLMPAPETRRHVAAGLPVPITIAS